MANQNNILLIDIGNSSLKWAEKKHGETLPLNMSQCLYPDAIHESFFTNCWSEIESPSQIFVSCVAHNELWQALVMACEKLWGIHIQRVQSSAKGYGLVNSYEYASDLGSDRWCAMIAVKHMSESAFMVVDAGSALTIDVVNESGQHLGGTISPGLKMMKKCLGVDTAQVKVDTAQNASSSFLGRSTKECVDAGALLSITSLIEAIFAKESLQVDDLQCILTGGDAKLIADSLSIKCVTIPDLVLRGLSEIQEMDQE